MQKFTLLSAVVAALVLTFAPGSADARSFFVRTAQDDVVYGTHPYEINARRVRDKINTILKYSDGYFYTHPDRSRTHGLHPYYRETYYRPPVDPLTYRYTRRDESDLRYRENKAYIPVTHPMGYCENYNFVRPSYRVPPYKFVCER